MGAAATTALSQSSSSTSEKMHKNFTMQYQIGQGGFSEVFLSIGKSDNSKVAVKRINIISALSHTRGLEALSNELQVYKRIGSHENIVKLHCSYRLQNQFYFVMDCLLGGDLRQYLHHNGKLSQKAICYIIASLGSGLHHMHQRGVFHRDIKPENIAFDQQGTPHLTDFGICHLATSDNSSLVSRESSGTLPYLAPEVLTKTHEHSYQSDFWSLGVMAYELVYGRRPFEPHVPYHFIYFVANHYGYLWNDSHNSTTEHIQSSKSPLPFPHYQVTFNEDGTVHPSLMVPLFPTRTSICHSASEKVDQSVMKLLKGLLDVRIPDRLGSIDQFEDFACHPAFVQYGYHTRLHLLTCVSPVLEEDWSGVLSSEIQNRTFKQQSSKSVDVPIQKFSQSIESTLEKLFYVRGLGADEAEVTDFKRADSLKTQQTSQLSPGRGHRTSSSASPSLQ
jgi:serine/threonine protein kinase